MLAILHGSYSHGALHLWAESVESYLFLTERSHAVPSGSASSSKPAAHPFSVPPEQLQSTLHAAGVLPAETVGAPDTIVLQLPRDLLGPTPSDRLSSVVGGLESGDRYLAPVHVPTLRLTPLQAMNWLLSLEECDVSAIELSQSIRYWSAVAGFVQGLLLRHRFVPSLVPIQGDRLKACWAPWLQDESIAEHVASLLAAMPPVVRAVDDATGHGPWHVLEPALLDLTDAAVRSILVEEEFADAIDGWDETDAHVAWLGGLLDHDADVARTQDDARLLLRDGRRWVGTLDERSEHRSWRLTMRIIEPSETMLAEQPDDQWRWRLQLGLVSGEDSTEVIDAEDLWTAIPEEIGLVADRVSDAQGILVKEVARAGRIFGLLELMLTEATPMGMDLTTDDAYRFMQEYRPLLEESGFIIHLPIWWGRQESRIGLRLQVDPLLEHQAGGDRGSETETSLGLSTLVQYRWQIAVGDQPLAVEEFRQLTSRNSPLMRIGDQWVEIHADHMAATAAVLEKEPDGTAALVDVIQLANGIGVDLGVPVTGIDATGWISDLLGESSGGGKLMQLDPPKKFQGELRPYQLTGLNWLHFLDRHGMGACLADDMGLGKTIQLIALLQAEREHSGDGPQPGPTLLVAPTSVVGNWQRELARFAPELTMHVQHGPDRPTGELFLESAINTDVTITTYALISRDLESLKRVPWHRIVLDEAQYIKNPPTKQAVAIRSLKVHRRVALTGTPVENRLSELWSIMDFCNPGYLGESSNFRRQFARPIERHNDADRASQLRTLVQPFILRRLKTDRTVIDDLPECVETKEYATLTPEQAAMYEEVVASMLGEVDRSQGMQRRGLILAMLSKLKQICNHPLQINDGRDLMSLVGVNGSDRSSLSSRSGKALRLMTLMEEVLATGERALIFTQYRRMGTVLGAMIEHDLDCRTLFLHGGTPSAHRQRMIDRFQDESSDAPVFILSLKAGGIGLNLTAANHVFHFDRWWNPAVENQATDRAFRIGQTRTVHVHKFVCLGTLEERIDEMIEQKMKLAHNIIGAGDSWLTEMSTGQLEDVLSLRQTAMEAER